MKSSIKRFLGIMLATLMVVTMLPAVAFADHTTEGSPNVFSIVADATGNQQTEFLFVDTLTQNGETYYGLMIRNSVHSWYPTQTLGVAGDNMGWEDDTTQTSTSTVVYKKLVAMSKGTKLKPLGGYLSNLYPASVVPYVGTLEHKISDYNNVTYKTVDSVTIPTWEILEANKEFVYLGGSSTHNYNGSITRGKPGWQGGADWIKAMRPDYSSCYGQMNTSNYNYYWHPLVYVTKDFFKNIKIDTTKEIGANVKTFMAENFNTLDVGNVGYTAEEIETLGIPELPSPEGDTFVVGGTKYYLVPDSTTEYKGETYVGVMTSQKTISWNADVDAPYLEFTETKDDGSVVGKLYRGVTDTKVDIQTYKNTFFSSFDGYIVDEDYEWSMGEARINSTDTVNTKLYGKGSISIPNTTEWSKLHTNSGAFNDGTGYLARNISYMGTGYEKQWRIWRSAQAGNSSATRVSDDEGKVIAFKVVGNYGYWNFMTMVKEDFFLENKLDLATTSSNVRRFLSNYSYADFTADYSKAEFDVLGITEFEEEVKPEVGTSGKFTVGGMDYYYVPGAEIEYNGETYWGIYNNAKLIGPWNPANDAGYLIVTGTKADGSLMTKLTKGTTAQKDIQDYKDTYFSAFNGYLVGSDYEWYMGAPNMNPDAIDTRTKIYFYGTIGVPSSNEFQKLYANDSAINDSAGLITRNVVFMGPYNDGSYYPRQWQAWKNASIGNATGTIYTDDEGNITGFDQGNKQYSKWGFMTYVKKDFFTENDIDMSVAGDNFKKLLVDNFSREDFTGWTKTNLDLLFGEYNGEGLGITASMTATGADVVIHNNGAEAAGAGKTLIIASYDADGMVDVKTYVIVNNVSAGSKTSALSFKLDMTGATSVKAMLWEDLLNAKPLTNAAFAN